MVNNLSPDIMNRVNPLQETNQYCFKFPFIRGKVNRVRYDRETNIAGVGFVNGFNKFSLILNCVLHVL